MGGPLEGVKVFEVSQILAAPYGGMMLADLGADVLKVESPDGDSTRILGAIVPNESKFFHVVNRGKRGLVLNLQRPEAQELVHRIIADYDVFIINARPGVSKRLQVDYDTLRQFRPDLVYVDSTGFGTEGPSAERSGSDVVSQGYSGLMANNHRIGEHGEPLMMSIAIGDMSTGLAMAMGVCAALFRRQITGQGEFIQTALLNSALSLLGAAVGRMPVQDAISVQPMLAALREAREAGANYQELIDIHEGSRAISTAFLTYYGTYVAQDGAIVVGALTPRNQAQIREALGLTGEDPLEDPEFDALDPEWNEQAVAFQDRVRALFRTKTMDEWIELMDAQGAPATKVNFPEEMADDPQVEAMGYMIDIDHPLTGPERMVGPILRMKNSPTGTDRPSPGLGGDADEVLSEHGLTVEEIAALREAGALG